MVSIYLRGNYEMFFNTKEHWYFDAFMTFYSE